MLFSPGDEDKLDRLSSDIEELPDEEDINLANHRGKSPLVRITALLLLVTFLTFTMGNALHLFTWPSLDFLAESQELGEDPDIALWQKAVVQVQAVGASDRQGTGFNINSAGVIITNHHLIEDAIAVQVSFAEQGPFPATVLFSDREQDLAILSLNSKESLPTVPLVEGLPEPGEPVTIIGNPLGFRRVIMSGTVAGYRGSQDSAVPILVITAPIRKGNSGSPVFAKDGGVVGMIFAVSQGNIGDETKALAIPVGKIRDALNRLNT